MIQNQYHDVLQVFAVSVHNLSLCCVLWSCKYFNFQKSSVISLKAFKPWRIPPTGLTWITIIMLKWAVYGVNKVILLFTYFGWRQNIPQYTRHPVLERIWFVGSSKHGMNPPKIYSTEYANWKTQACAFVLLSSAGKLTFCVYLLTVPPHSNGFHEKKIAPADLKSFCFGQGERQVYWRQRLTSAKIFNKFQNPTTSQVKRI